MRIVKPHTPTLIHRCRGLGVSEDYQRVLKEIDNPESTYEKTFLEAVKSAYDAAFIERPDLIEGFKFDAPGKPQRPQRLHRVKAFDMPKDFKLPFRCQGVLKYHLFCLFDKYEIDYKTVDTYALLDSTLTYQENKTILKDYLELMKFEKDCKTMSEVKNEIEKAEALSERDLLTHVLDIIRECEREFNAPVMLSEIHEKAAVDNLDIVDVEFSIERLKQDGQIYDPYLNQRFKVV